MRTCDEGFSVDSILDYVIRVKKHRHPKRLGVGDGEGVLEAPAEHGARARARTRVGESTWAERSSFEPLRTHLSGFSFEALSKSMPGLGRRPCHGWKAWRMAEKALPSVKDWPHVVMLTPG